MLIVLRGQAIIILGDLGKAENCLVLISKLTSNRSNPYEGGPGSGGGNGNNGGNYNYVYSDGCRAPIPLLLSMVAFAFAAMQVVL